MSSLPVFGSRTYIMGILNVTPDSFSGDGLLAQRDPIHAALERARHFVAAGADILDVGGESTRPGAATISAQEEIERTAPVIEALAKELDILISIDTCKASVAQAALAAGADWINDVWALQADPLMGAVAVQAGAPIILMHNRSKPGNAEVQARLGGRYIGMQYTDLLAEVRAELLEAVERAHIAGIGDEQIILDPGIGFGKTVEQNLELLDRLDELRSLGYPLLVGPSRKSFIGYTLDAPPGERLEGTAAAVAVAITRGADIVRIHDVAALARLVKMTDAIIRRSAK